MDNPYSPPKALLEPADAPADVKTFLSNSRNRVLGRRMLATPIDYVVLFCFLLIPQLALGDELYLKTMWLWLAMMAAYFPVMEGFTGYSVGKFICRARVVDNAGNLPGMKKALIRTVFRLVEVNPFLFGGIPAAVAAGFSKSGQRLGDMVAETYVVASGAVDQLRREGARA